MSNQMHPNVQNKNCHVLARMGAQARPKAMHPRSLAYVRSVGLVLITLHARLGLRAEAYCCSNNLVNDLEHHQPENQNGAMAFTTDQLLMLAGVVVLVLYVSRMWLKQHEPNLPPGPTPLPIIGCFHLLGKHPHRTLADLARKYGPLMSIQLGQKLCIVATSPEAAREFLKVQDANFSSRPPQRAADVCAPHDIICHSLTPALRHLKKILVSELTSAKRLEASKYIRTEEMAFMLKAVSEEAGPFQLKTHLNIMSTNILSRMVLSKRFLGATGPDQSLSEIREFMGIIKESNICFSAIHPQDVFNCVPEWFDPQGWNVRFRKLRARTDVFYANMVKQHKAERQRNPVSEKEKTLLDVLLEQIDNKEYEVNEDHVKGAVWDALAAGTETTMLTIEWAMSEVLKNATLLKAARSELDRVVGSNRMVHESDIPQLRYIQAIVKETLRLHATTPLLPPHQNDTAAEVLGYDIPANTRVFVNAWAIARDPSVWENPLEFVPERFLPEGQYGSRYFQGQHFEFIPFGSGRRMCPGMILASMSMHLEVANLLHAFDWSLPDGMALDVLDMSEGQGLIVPRKSPLVVVVKPRATSVI